MSGYTPAKKTARAQRTTNASRVIAQGMANLRSAKGMANLRGAKARRATARSRISPSGPAQVNPDPDAADLPRDEPGEPSATRAYVAKEHLRKDIGSRVLVLDLAAPDVPPGAPGPARDADGKLMQYVADCVTHHEQKHFGAYATACRAAKASHQWCNGCKSDLARHHRLHSKASAQSSPRR